MTNARLDLAAVQARLASSQGRDYWRSLEELAETDSFQEFLYREFPRQASEWLPSLNRRNFLKLMGASLALAGLTACASEPPAKIVPYVQAPEETIPGQPLFFATAMQLGGYAMGLLAQSQLNRPTKLEGNPDH
ncbi:MAG: TAT-variant-translocated molybdopterin oxidoreductase, partial [Chloroflexi bacterium]|nr:TAT-variant-translocated molybdopterin oxidoreductase [Chloroflexota bacterium]